MTGVLRISAVVATLAIPPLAAPQSEAAQFEAASIKRATPDLPGGRIGALPPTGGPGTADPGRISYRAVSLKSLLMRAYDVENFQIAGPGWLDSELFELTATMSPNTNNQQFRVMLQGLLADRFQLKIHRETREFSGYSLVVAKNGPKFKPSMASVPQQGDVGDSSLKLGSDGFFVPPPQPGVFLQMAGSGVRTSFRQVTMQTLASTLQRQLRRPLTDVTGLNGSYDFVLNYSREGLDFGRLRIPVSLGDGEPQPDIFGALSSQLGLRLEPKKTSAEVIVIDEVEKTAKEN